MAQNISGPFSAFFKEPQGLDRLGSCLIYVILKKTVVTISFGNLYRVITRKEQKMDIP